jgi:glycerophosphoryl diester phosphodiesterase
VRAAVLSPSLALAVAVGATLALGALACDSGDTTVSPLDAGADVAAPPPVDPSLFDCTSLAKPPLARRATSDATCLRDPHCRGRFVSGHRGAGGQLGRVAPEDTLAAYRAAIAMGADIVETDPRPTADGVIVNVHDPTLDRTTDGTGDVAATTFDAIRKLHIRADGLAGDFSCEKVPTLEELLVTCRGRALVLVDGNKTDRVADMVAAIVKADALDWAVFDTSDTAKIDAALAIEPRLMIMPRAEADADIAPLLAKYKDHAPAFVELSNIFPRGADVVHAAGLRTLTDAFGADFGVRNGQDRKVYVDLFDQGADVVQSDLPDEVLRALGRPVPPP